MCLRCVTISLKRLDCAFQIGGLPNYYNFVSANSPAGKTKGASPAERSTLTRRMIRDRRIVWIAEQYELERHVRDGLLLTHDRMMKLSSHNTELEDRVEMRISKEVQPNDPYWEKQWYMVSDIHT
jgi:hypothetical protein